MYGLIDDDAPDFKATSIDWSKPIEAYHVDGRVVAVTTQGPDRDGDYNTDGEFDGFLGVWTEKGEPWSGCQKGWRIRNVAPDFKPCERTVRMCIEAINGAGGGTPNHHRYQNALLAVKSKADPAKALVEEFAGSGTATKVHVTDDGIRPFVDPLEFARWLVDTGRVKP